MQQSSQRLTPEQQRQVDEVKRWARAEYTRTIPIVHHGGEVSQQRSPYYAEAAALLALSGEEIWEQIAAA